MGTLIPLVVLVIVFLLIAVREVGNVDFRIWQVVLLGAVAVLVTGSIAPLDALASINLDVMLFILMASVWQSGLFQPLIEGSLLDLGAVPVIVATGVVVSQFISNVPFVALFLPAISRIGTSTVGLMALAAGSTIAGNMLILGAASNVIVIQGAEKEGETLTFAEFARVGIPLTLAQAVVYILWLSLIPA